MRLTLVDTVFLVRSTLISKCCFTHLPSSPTVEIENPFKTSQTDWSLAANDSIVQTKPAELYWSNTIMWPGQVESSDHFRWCNMRLLCLHTTLFFVQAEITYKIQISCKHFAHLEISKTFSALTVARIDCVSWCYFLNLMIPLLACKIPAI